MDRVLIRELARRYMTVEPQRLRTENALLRCPFSGDSEYHPGTDKGSLSFSVLVAPFGQSKARCFEQAHIHFDGGFEEVIAWLREVEQGGFAGALTQARMARLADEMVAPPDAQRIKDLERYAFGCHRRGVHPYLLARGIIKLDYERWKIGFDPEARGPGDTVTPRSTFPVWNQKGRLVGVSRRACDNETHPKYHDQPTGRWKADVFYGEHRVDPTLGHVRLVEGVPGTIVASRSLPNVLGVLGSSTKIEGIRLEKIRSWAKVVTLLYDGDEAGHNAVWGYEDVRGRWHPGLRELLCPYVAVLVGTFPSGGDPDSVSTSVLVRTDREARGIAFDNGTASTYSPPPYQPSTRDPKATPASAGDRQG